MNASLNDYVYKLYELEKENDWLSSIMPHGSYNDLFSMEEWQFLRANVHHQKIMFIKLIKDICREEIQNSS